MKLDRFSIAISLLSIVFLIYYPVKAEQIKIKLNSVNIKQGLPKTIQSRISIRNFKKTPLKKEQLSLILWSAGGIKVDAVSSASRTIPSAGATYPLEFYVVVGKNSLEGIAQGIYHYSIEEHALELLSDKDIRTDLSLVCLNQKFIEEAPVSIIIAAQYGRTTKHYADRGIRYVLMEVGHSCQNIYLMVTDLNLATVEVGAFYDNSVKNIIGLEKDIEPLIIMPIGYAR